MPEDYIPYGPEWEKEMMTMRKKDLVNILKDYFKRHKNIKKIVNDLVAGIEAWGQEEDGVPENFKAYNEAKKLLKTFT